MKIDSVIFYSNNIEKLIDFYKKLNFKIEYQQDYKFISFIFKNHVRLGIKKSVENRELPGSQTVFIEVDNINKLYQDVTKKGFKINKNLVDQNWSKNFSILDPDGNKIQFINRH